MQSELGKKLSKAREARSLSIEEAAHATRLRPSHVQALEEGNLARFPNAAYAKGFLTMYARFLGVDVTDFSRTIETNTLMRVGDFQYLSNRSRDVDTRKDDASDSLYDFVVPDKARSWVPLFVFGGVALAALVAFIVWTNMSRIDQAVEGSGKAVPSETPPDSETAAVEKIPDVAAQDSAGTQAATVAEPEPEIPRPIVVSVPEGTIPAAIPVVRKPAPAAAPEAEIPRARPVSPIATLAADDSTALAEIKSASPPSPALKTGGPAASQPAAGPSANTAAAEPQAAADLEEESPIAADPRTVILEPQRKAWVVIRTGPGGQPLYEDFLYPSAKPMRLPAGRYFIELKEADSVQISRNGRPIAYSPPGVLVE